MGLSFMESRPEVPHKRIILHHWLFYGSPVLLFVILLFCRSTFCGSAVRHSAVLRFDILRFCGSAVLRFAF